MKIIVLNNSKYRLLEICHTEVFESPKWTALPAGEIIFFFYFSTTVFAKKNKIVIYLRNIPVMGNSMGGLIDLFNCIICV